MGMGINLKLYLTVAAGCWMAGEGARMVMMGLFHQDQYYQPNLFDILFDWVPLTVIGIIFLTIGIRDFYKNCCERSFDLTEVESVDTPNRRKAKPLN
jgi:hypothetical protein